jgi:hypothetical protein
VPTEATILLELRDRFHNSVELTDPDPPPTLILLNTPMGRGGGGNISTPTLRLPIDFPTLKTFFLNGRYGIRFAPSHVGRVALVYAPFGASGGVYLVDPSTSKPYSTQVRSGPPDVAKCRAYGAAIEAGAVADAAAFVYVQLRDAYDNKVTGEGSGTLRASFSRGLPSVGPAVWTGADGLYLLRYVFRV